MPVNSQGHVVTNNPVKQLPVLGRRLSSHQDRPLKYRGAKSSKKQPHKPRVLKIDGQIKESGGQTLIGEIATKVTVFTQCAVYLVTSSVSIVRRMLGMNAQPECIVDAQLVPPRTIKIRFADGELFSLPIKRLQMAIDEIDWASVATSETGMAMTVRDLDGSEISIDSATVRCIVDKSYAAKAKDHLETMQLTRDEFRSLLEISKPPPGW